MSDWQPKDVSYKFKALYPFIEKVDCEKMQLHIMLDCNVMQLLIATTNSNMLDL